MAEDIQFKITADEAGAVNAFKRVRNEVLNNEHGLKQVGKQGKITSTALKDAANVLGPEFGMLGDRIDHISGALGDIKGASLIAKASLVTLVAVGGLEIGKMIGDWAFETSRWKDELEAASKKVAELQKQVSSNAAARASGMTQEELQTEIRGVTDSIQRQVKQVEESEKAWSNFSTGDYWIVGENNRRKEVEQTNKNIEAQRDLLKVYQNAQKEQRKAEESSTAKAEIDRQKAEADAIKMKNDALEKQTAEQDRHNQTQTDYLANLDLELVKLKEGEEAYERKRMEMLKYSDTTIEKALQIKAAIEQESQLRRASESSESSGPTGSIGQRGEIRGDQQRFITRGIGMKGDEKLLAAAKEQAQRAKDLLAESKKQTALLAKLPKGVTE